jgi:cyclohexanone monooxygenase
MNNFNILVSGGYQPEDLVADGWTDIIRKLLVMVQSDPGGNAGRDIMQTMELADFQKMEQIRARVDAIVENPLCALWASTAKLECVSVPCEVGCV